MGSYQIATIQDWGITQKQMNEMLRLSAYAQPQTGFGFPTDPADGMLFIMRPTNDWYQFRDPAWVAI